jgi:hypothetical protein
MTLPAAGRYLRGTPAVHDRLYRMLDKKSFSARKHFFINTFVYMNIKYILGMKFNPFHLRGQLLPFRTIERVFLFVP